MNLVLLLYHILLCVCIFTLGLKDNKNYWGLYNIIHNVRLRIASSGYDRPFLLAESQGSVINSYIACTTYKQIVLQNTCISNVEIFWIKK